jgi:hypothetical protein
MKWYYWGLIALFIGSGGGYIYMTTRGLRNNNPGNIRRTSDQWQGLKTIQSDVAFFQFVNPVYGIRALAKILRNYQEKYGLRTIETIISRWAPPNENDTGAYIRHVANVVGVAPDDAIDVNDLDIMMKLVNGIIKHENGINPYSDATIKSGIEMAFG